VNGTVDQSHATGNVTAGSGVGIVGACWMELRMISKSYATGSVTNTAGEGSSGGLVGSNEGKITLHSLVGPLMEQVTVGYNRKRGWPCRCERGWSCRRRRNYFSVVF